MIKLVDGNHQKKIDFTPTVDTVAGSAVLLGDTVTITSVDIPAGLCGAVNWPNGGAQYSIPNADGVAYALGAPIFVDANNEGVPAGGLGRIGFVSEAALATDPEVRFVHER